MILNTGNRTDIPAFYSRWFYNRIREGFVMVRNPYAPSRVTRYKLDPGLVDVICFCSKDPSPMLPRLHELDAFNQFWFMTITPYGREPCRRLPRLWRRSAGCRRHVDVEVSVGGTIRSLSLKNMILTSIAGLSRAWLMNWRDIPLSASSAL